MNKATKIWTRKLVGVLPRFTSDPVEAEHWRRCEAASPNMVVPSVTEAVLLDVPHQLAPGETVTDLEGRAVQVVGPHPIGSEKTVVRRTDLIAPGSFRPGSFRYVVEFNSVLFPIEPDPPATYTEEQIREALDLVQYRVGPLRGKFLAALRGES